MTPRVHRVRALMVLGLGACLTGAVAARVQAPPGAAPPPEAIVVGAGLSGLSAAVEMTPTPPGRASTSRTRAS